MTLAEAIAIIQRNIIAREKGVHQDYARVVALAELYLALMAGEAEQTATLLKRFVQRETEEMFAQRVALTQLVTPALCNSVQMPFNKVGRNSKITKRIDVKDSQRKQAVEKMVKEFYGDSPDEEGLELFLQSRFYDLSFADPNAWVVIEFDDFDNRTQRPRPRPFEVSSQEAVNFEFKNNVLNWLLVKTAITYTAWAKNSTPNSFVNARETEQKQGFRFTLYTQGETVIYDQADRDWVKDTGANTDAGRTFVELDLTGRAAPDLYYEQKVVNPRIGVVHAKRVGYKTDILTKSRTFVSPIHKALNFLLKSVKVVSELDLTMTLHTFPQKIQMVPKCPGTQDKPCDHGKCLDGRVCTECKGSGWKIPSSAQDVIILPMPDPDTPASEMLDPSRLVHYVSPPTDIINVQIAVVDSFESKVHRAVFSSDVFVTATNVKTATEKRLEMDSIHDVLSPYAKNVSSFYKFAVNIMFSLADTVKQDETKVVYSFPPDFNLKTVESLLADMKMMADSGAPSFAKDVISDGIAEILYQDDPIKQKEYATKKSMFPFPGKTPEEILELLASEYVTKFNKILYSNFENILAELAREDRTFYLKSFDEQYKAVGTKVNLIIDELKKTEVDRFNASVDIGRTDGSADGAV